MIPHGVLPADVGVEKVEWKRWQEPLTRTELFRWVDDELSLAPRPSRRSLSATLGCARMFDILSSNAARRSVSTRVIRPGATVSLDEDWEPGDDPSDWDPDDEESPEVDGFGEGPSGAL